MTIWPPALDDLKADLGVDDDRDDAVLSEELAAAVAYATRVRSDVIDDDTTEMGGDLVLGVLRLAGRWHTRRRSPDALVQMAELGSARVPSVDPDIERMLGVGRWRKAASA